MIFIIFGTTSRASTIDSGRFFCPQCQSKQPYELKEVTRYGHLYFIPLLPLYKASEYVECEKCRGTS